jgi:hypothetical protein
MTANDLRAGLVPVAGFSGYVTEIWCPPADDGVQRLHSHMREPEPEARTPEPYPELEAEL